MVPIFIPKAETETMFEESFKNIYTISFDSWYTDRTVVNDGLEFQVHKGSAQKINNPEYLIAAHHFSPRIVLPNKASNIAIFDNLDIRKCFREMDGQRYP